MINRLIIAGLTLLLTILIACAPGSLRAQPLGPPPDLCEDVVCGEGMQCSDGQCVCGSGTKNCGDSCISEGACCTTDDCAEGRTCSNNVCVQRPVCNLYEEWDEKREECACAEGAKFCSEQGKCIPADNCCWHNACYDDQRCAPTRFSATICLDTADGNLRKCRVVHSFQAEPFDFQDRRYMIELSRVLEGGKFDIRVDDESFKGLERFETKDITAERRVFVDELLEFGGYCRQEPD